MKIATTTIACLIWQTNAFMPISTTTRTSSSIFAMPNEPFQFASGSVQPDSFVREQQRPEYRREGRSYYPEQQQPGPEEWSAGSMEYRERPEPGRRRNYENTVQGGGSRRTFPTSGLGETNVQIASEGRPIYTRAQVWEGPDNTPASMSLYSEDGWMQPWNAGFRNRGSSTGSSVLDLRNTGPLEFPVEVAVSGRRQETIEREEQGQRPSPQTYRPSPERVTQTVQGGSLKYFNVKAGVQAVVVELSSEGRPMYAQVELWQGPGNIKQCAEIYSDNGMDRVWSAVIETHGRECTVAVRNTGPGLVYPFKASVDPLY